MKRRSCLLSCVHMHAFGRESTWHFQVAPFDSKQPVASHDKQCDSMQLSSFPCK